MIGCPPKQPGLGAEAASADASSVCTIRRLNDDFRRSFIRGRGLRNDGVSNLAEDELAQLLQSVRQFDAFDIGNDPHGEHDFGAVDQGGVRYFWKIDYYDNRMQFASPDPADANLTTRVLTIMRADEYGKDDTMKLSHSTDQKTNSRSTSPLLGLSQKIKTPSKMTRYWIMGGLAVIGIAALIGGGSSPANLCVRSDTKSALNDAFIGKLAKLGGRLMDDYAIQGQRGTEVVCSVSFSIGPLTQEMMAAIDKTPQVAGEVAAHFVTLAMVPNLMVRAQTHPGQPLVQRVTYRVTPTLDDQVLVTVLDFPGARNR